MIFELVADFAAALRSMPAHDPRHHILELLDEAIRRDIQFIARHPTTLFQCMWNLCWWYDCPAAADHYVEGEAPGACHQLGLYLHLEDWRNARKQRAGTSWLNTWRPPPVHLGSSLAMIFPGGNGWILGIAFSSDSRRIVSIDANGIVYIWDADSGAELACFAGPVFANCVAIAPDGTSVASGSSFKTVGLWDAATGKELVCFRGHEGAVYSVTFSPDGRRVASGSNDKTVRIWETEIGVELACLSGHEEMVLSVAFSPDGTRIASASLDKTIRIWDTVTGEELAILQGHEEAVLCVTFSPDGRRLASGSVDETIRIWEADKGTELACLRGHIGEVWSVAFSSDGAQLVSGASDETVRVWAVASSTTLASLQGHEGAVLSVAFSPDGKRIASGSKDETVRAWNATSTAKLFSVRGPLHRPSQLRFTRDGKCLASWPVGNTVSIRNAISGTGLACLRKQECDVSCVVFSSDGSRLAGIWNDNTVSVWDVATGAEVAYLRGYEVEVTKVVFSPEGSRLVAGFSDGTVRIWDTERDTELACLQCLQADEFEDDSVRRHLAGVTSLTYSPDGSRLASASQGGGIHIWGTHDWVELASFYAYNEMVRSRVTPPDDPRRASVPKGSRFKVRSASGPPERIGRVAFSPDGSLLAGASSDRTMRVWDTSNGECVWLLDGDGDESAIAKVMEHRVGWIAITREWEFVILDPHANTPVAWFPKPLYGIATSRTADIWAGHSGHQTYILSLEGTES